MEETGFSEKMKLMKEKPYRRSYGTISAANSKLLANNSSVVYIRHDLQVHCRPRFRLLQLLSHTHINFIVFFIA